MKKSGVEQVFRTFEKINPAPVTELKYENDFQLLIAVMLSAQATDISVNLATPALFAKAPDPKAMLKLGETGIKNLIKSIGLYNTKAKNILKSCQILVNEYDGKIPNTREELEKLPGVGTKTAGVVMNVAFKALTIPVDTHVFRVSNRIGLVKTNSEQKTEVALLKVLPKWTLVYAHHWLILHGRYICKARKPECLRCPINKFCEYTRKTT